jgi:hypothetical protein
MISLIMMANLRQFEKHVFCIIVQRASVKDDAPSWVQSTCVCCVLGNLTSMVSSNIS